MESPMKLYCFKRKPPEPSLNFLKVALHVPTMKMVTFKIFISNINKELDYFGKL